MHPPTATVIDANVLFGPWPKSSLDCSLSTVLQMLGKAGISGAVIASLRASLYDDRTGNHDTLSACTDHADLAPAAGLRLRAEADVPGRVEVMCTAGFRLLRLFPENEGWPIDFAPFELALRQAGQCQMPVMVAATGPGDITALGRMMARTPASVIVTGVNVSHTPLLTEAIAVGRDTPGMYIETSRLEGIDTVDTVAQALGPERLIFGTGMPFQYPSSALALIGQSSLSTGDRDMVLRGNISRLLADV